MERQEKMREEKTAKEMNRKEMKDEGIEDGKKVKKENVRNKVEKGR